MELFLPAHCNEIGQRSNNEDAIYPYTASKDARLFMVCDGVGGQAKGEMASSMACENLAAFVRERPITDIKDASYMPTALQYVEQQMETYLGNHPEAVGMATTLTFLYLSDIEKKALIAWIGDSRAYHIRDGQILYRTKDHSVVQGMVDVGEITEEEAQTHPKRNIITRAINGSNPTRIDQKVIVDIKKNDFFLLCTDGILESLNNNIITSIFKKDASVEEIKSYVLCKAKGMTMDNYSMFIIKVRASI
ncbi:MAG: protein phosphatase 2C domain-containing protein [Flavobacteriaceae bacterium]|nr:protein phosphatase 2C domain-containing protein [Flavobacteriaceae bacterium]